MANSPIGNNIWEGPLGVVNVEFNGVPLGKTTAETTLAKDQDLKDIIYQQDGTKFADKVRTGIAYMVNCTFGEISTALLEKMMPGFVASNSGNSLNLGRSLYQSMKDDEAKVLLLKRVDSNGNSSTDLRHRLKLYKAAPEITGEIQWGADVQRNLAITFHIFWDEAEDSFGYSGYASSLGLTP